MTTTNKSNNNLKLWVVNPQKKINQTSLERQVVREYYSEKDKELKTLKKLLKLTAKASILILITSSIMLSIQDSNRTKPAPQIASGVSEKIN
jgi:hypothetical protein